MKNALFVSLLAVGIAGSAQAQTSYTSSAAGSSIAPASTLIGTAAGAACYAADDGVTELSLGLTNGGEAAWMMGFTAPAGGDVITGVSSAFGSATFPSLVPGQSGSVAVWDDPTNDFDPTDAVLLFSGPITSADEDTDILTNFPVPNVAVTGVFFVGVSVDHGVGTFPAPIDQSVAGGGRAWIVGSTLGPGTLDFANLAANDVPPLDVDAIGFPGVFLVRADANSCGSFGTPYCTSNANSVDAAGSAISGAGSTSIGDMDVTLTATNAPAGQGGLFFFGPAQTDAPLACGRLCISGSLVRMPVVFETGGNFTYNIDFATYGTDIASLGTVNFQCWYRDPANAAACGNTSNLSNGLEITFTP